MKKLVAVCLMLSFGVCEIDIPVCKRQVEEYNFVCVEKMLFIEKVIIKQISDINGIGIGAGVGLTSIPNKTCECVMDYGVKLVIKESK